MTCATPSLNHNANSPVWVGERKDGLVDSCRSRIEDRGEEVLSDQICGARQCLLPGILHQWVLARTDFSDLL